MAPSILLWPDPVPDASATVGYVANWHFVTGNAGYFAASGPPSPLLHTWSLAIEEQFYLLWPLVVLAVFEADAGARPAAVAGTDGDDEGDLSGGSRGVPVAGRPGRSSWWPPRRSARDRAGWEPERARRLEVLLAISVVQAVASAVVMAVITPVGGDPTRAYYGTDTGPGPVGRRRPGRRLRPVGFGRSGARGRGAMAGLAVVGVAGTALLWWRVPETSSLAFHGGFLLASLAAAAVVAGAVQAPASPVPRVLGWGPVRALGRISYGVYLWYSPCCW